MPAPWRNSTAGFARLNARPPVDANSAAPSTVRIIAGLDLLRRPQRLAEIVQDIGHLFDADRESDQVLAQSGSLQRFGVHLLVRGARRMDHQRLGIADIRQMGSE